MSDNRKRHFDDMQVSRLKSMTNIVEIVGEFVDLRRSGKDWTGICPFHADRHTGNFIVSESKQVASCFACGWKGDALKFLMAVKGIGYVESVRWLSDYYGVDLYGDTNMSESVDSRRARLRKDVRRVSWSDMPLVEFPKSMVVRSMSPTQPASPLVTWLRSLEWTIDERQRLERWLQLYLVGQSDVSKPRTGGWTIWWYVDDQNRVRTGKLMAYRSDGHRDKTLNPYRTSDGVPRYYNFDFVHSMLEAKRMAKSGKKGWWNEDESRCELCLFGLHLVDVYPDAEVCIVESEKTALIAQVISDPKDKLFMATGSKGALTRRLLLPLIERGRTIVLYPDVDGIDEWRKRADALGYERIKVTDRVSRLYDPGLDDPKSDIADIIVRMRTPGTDVSATVHNRLGLTAPNAALNGLIREFNCMIDYDDK